MCETRRDAESSGHTESWRASEGLSPWGAANGPTEWLAWETLTTASRVLAVLAADGAVPAATAGQIVTVILDRSPCYAESGGQDSDADVLTGASVEAEVLDVQRPLPDLVTHQVRITAGKLAPGDAVHAAVDPEFDRGALSHPALTGMT